MEDCSRPLIASSSFVNWEAECSLDIVLAKLQPAEQFDIFCEGKRVVHFAESIATDGIFAKDSSRSHEHECRHLVVAKFACSHACHYATLRVSEESDLRNERKRRHILIYSLSIFYLVGHSHVLEEAFALAMTIEIEAHGSDFAIYEFVSNQFMHSTFIATKTMHLYYYRTFLTFLQSRLFDNDREFAHRALNGGLGCNLLCEKIAGNESQRKN